jgi:Tfp pilus assembly protein PilO
METVQTENKSFVRDLHSKALLNTDRVALENHRQKMRLQEQQKSEWQIMKNKVDELNTVREEMLEIKSLLRELLNKKEL